MSKDAATVRRVWSLRAEPGVSQGGQRVARKLGTLASSEHALEVSLRHRNETLSQSTASSQAVISDPVSQLPARKLDQNCDGSFGQIRPF